MYAFCMLCLAFVLFSCNMLRCFDYLLLFVYLFAGVVVCRRRRRRRRRRCGARLVHIVKMCHLKAEFKSDDHLTINLLKLFRQMAHRDRLPTLLHDDKLVN